MVLSHVQTDTPMAIVRAAAWSNSLSRMGVHLPLFLIHDIGVMLSMSRGAGGYVLRPREASSPASSCRRTSSRSSTSTAGCSRTSPASEVTERLAGLRLRDEMVAVLLSRILGDTYNRWRDRSKSAGVEPLPLDLGILGEIDYADHFRDFDPRGAVGLRRAPRRAVDAHLHAGRADRPRHRAPARPVQGGQRVGQRGARRRDRSRRSVRRARLARGERRRELLARPAAERARDPALDGRADVRGRRLRVDRAQGQHRLARALRARVRPRDLRAEGRRQRAALLRPRQAARGRAPAAVPADRLLGVDARPAPGVRARPRARADQEAHARGRRDLGAVLRLAPARDDQDRPLGPGAGAVSAVVPQRARPQLRQGVSPAARRGHAPAPRAEAPRRDVRDHARPVSHRAGARRPRSSSRRSSTASSCLPSSRPAARVRAAARSLADRPAPMR